MTHPDPSLNDIPSPTQHSLSESWPVPRGMFAPLHVVLAVKHCALPNGEGERGGREGGREGRSGESRGGREEESKGRRKGGLCSVSKY